jgi:hypothetical protein
MAVPGLPVTVICWSTIRLAGSRPGPAGATVTAKGDPT